MSKEKAYCAYCGSKLQHSIFTDANSPKWCANSCCNSLVNAAKLKSFSSTEGVDFFKSTLNINHKQ